MHETLHVAMGLMHQAVCSAVPRCPFLALVALKFKILLIDGRSEFDCCRHLYHIWGKDVSKV